ncbi:hypothetical protein L6452_07407 [Arctium lappa]|uniref:Uncharacterized protein n=1 Tax=Arctium lappa TaxID=4217 RepID=A0ACB9ELM3_ARCLA|nr:hypothetical protein L6452_07407 [Arctium lappa]
MVMNLAHLTLAFGLLGNIVSFMMESLKLIVLLIVVGFGLIVVLTQFFASGVTRGVIVGWICLVFSLCVFVAPLGVLIPNVLGFTFGIIQMILYFVYKNKKPITDEKISQNGEQKYTIGKTEERKVVEIKDHKTIDVVKFSALLSSDVLPAVAKLKENEHDAVEPQARPNVPNHIIEVAV